MMLLTRQYPNTKKLDLFLDRSKALPFNYREVGHSKKGGPPGYNFDQNEVLLGIGRPLFEGAKQALRSWKMFDLKWVRLYPEDRPIQKGEIVAVNFRLFGFWWSNSCEIVYTINESNAFGFAYGTKSHVESGEEIFKIWIDGQDRVYYQIQAFSWPAIWLSKLAYPLTRFYQRKFVRESQQAMGKALKN